MYAAISAARNGADTVLVDKSLISRGGATIMAQMTVAAAVGEQEPDHWTHHLRDTLEAGRGLCNEELAAILCEEARSAFVKWKVGKSVGHVRTTISNRSWRRAIRCSAASMSIS